MENKDYRIRTIHINSSKEEGIVEEYRRIIHPNLKQDEAALISKKIIIVENDKVNKDSIITIKNPKKEKIDYINRLDTTYEQEYLHELKEEYTLTQKQLKQITGEYNKYTKNNELMDKLYIENAVGVKHKKEKIKEITIEIVLEDRLNKWRSAFENHYEGIINCLSNLENYMLTTELKEELENKGNILSTYFDDVTK
ncbi:hypothetical protein BC6307_21295 [Sutcliffiella cohnii]|uniref:Uncharacterized protein n=1 Tax=Sutcliffiella cohnii TaxID=33932 RepID=A0A223KW09_9BACI|nr:hypothetical protein [Sutcliffiella cohnii]AST93620.1 hypothetical protein BC6307_21295 [Sutcliffiella cohnii]